MSIKPIDAIPTGTHKQSARDMIRADICEAISKGIRLFEFDGDYNYKTLGGNVADIIKEIKRKEICRIQSKFREEFYSDDEKNIKGFHTFFKSAYEYKNYWITVKTTRGDEHRRVFCELGDSKSFESQVIEDCKQALAEARAEHKIVDGKWRRIR